MKKDSGLVARQRTVLSLMKDPGWAAFREMIQIVRDDAYQQFMGTDPANENAIATQQGMLVVCDQILRLDVAIQEDMDAEAEQSSG